MLIRALSENDFLPLHHTLSEVFAEKNRPFFFNKWQAQQRWQRIGAVYPASFGAFEKEKLVGFLISAAGEWRGKNAIYNGGMGILKSYRNRGIATQLYAHLEEKVAAQVLLLEVLVENKAAQAFYERMGFAVLRQVACYLAQHSGYQHFRSGAVISKQAQPDWFYYQTLQQEWQTTYPTWQNLPAAISRNAVAEICLEAHWGEKLVGFISLDVQNGRISQIAVAPDFRRRKIGSQLLQQAQNLVLPKFVSILNIETHPTIEAFFSYHRFKRVALQYEMQKEIQQQG
ncbi:GNAT family N-acetyltransferase [Hugenholtzia roseola]|uniref:GNAT family N-acetyltransferase n=1 Tax=Hugenholtzia roseola TaxID=1002 RepID=UPI0004230D46|nr:GNAT family N-acetyltransferase [Hugenholtzia roseola]